MRRCAGRLAQTRIISHSRSFYDGDAFVDLPSAQSAASALWSEASLWSLVFTKNSFHILERRSSGGMLETVLPLAPCSKANLTSPTRESAARLNRRLDDTSAIVRGLCARATAAWS